ncbi:hypothetical protein PIB30_010451 [Stylosanthes scabra]|uniref:Neutral ceramidase n=1 Tax=Stylosanthes scabra TaxID=79078 RepID=A0ABU6Y4Z0_9FABA|nr:hypothetical protein [Stylosanthes scabra]
MGGDVYTEKNVAISGIHTHAGPGGYLQYLVYIVASLGFVCQSFDVLVEGIEKSIVQAHVNFCPRSVRVNKGYRHLARELLDACINRSPSAHLNNPAGERKKYTYDVDKHMTLLKFVDDDFGPVGSFNWFATHGTSMSRTNSLISGDNKGAAAWFMEDCQIDKERQGAGYPDEFESTRIIGERQFRKAVQLFNEAEEETVGDVDYRHAYVDLSSLKVIHKRGASKVVRTCPASMGFAFAAGTTDGPGTFDFTQGDDKGNPFWKLVRDLLKMATKEQIDCQHPKPILLDTGEIKKPYDWAPSILPIQILRIGQFVILCVPGDPQTLTSASAKTEDAVLIAGLTNSYSQYVTTYEEYQVQRYEGASTLYGPHALSTYIQEFKKLAKALISDQLLEPGPIKLRTTRTRCLLPIDSWYMSNQSFECG